MNTAVHVRFSSSELQEEKASLFLYQGETAHRSLACNIQRTSATRDTEIDEIE